MKSFKLNGVTYKNGYACDDRGRPRTINCGYSSDDEKEARQEYEEALLLIEKGAVPSSIESENISTLSENNDVEEEEGKKEETGKFSEKYELDIEELTKEDWDAMQMPSKYYENGYLLNDAGQEINFENGYSDSDIKETKDTNGRYF